ncbi:MAG TPA: helix-turn-helix transcriptional regulator [Gemmatimonadales bacterium]
MASFRRARGSDQEDLPGELTRQIVDEVSWYMRQHKVTRADLAQSMRVSPGRVSQILSGDENLTLRTLGSVLAALGATFTFTVRPIDERIDLLDGEEPDDAVDDDAVDRLRSAAPGVAPRTTGRRGSR